MCKKNLVHNFLKTFFLVLVAGIGFWGNTCFSSQFTYDQAANLYNNIWGNGGNWGTFNYYNATLSQVPDKTPNAANVQDRYVFADDINTIVAVLRGWYQSAGQYFSLGTESPVDGVGLKLEKPLVVGKIAGFSRRRNAAL